MPCADAVWLYFFVRTHEHLTKTYESEVTAVLPSTKKNIFLFHYQLMSGNVKL